MFPALLKMNDATGSASTVPGMIALYASSLLSGAWTMIIPTIPVLAKHFGISAGTGAENIEAIALGIFAGGALAAAGGYLSAS